MFDFDASKLLIIGIVALVFIPSKDLPRVLRQMGQFVGKMRRMASEFQTQFMDAMREADLTELKREAEKLAKAAELDPNFPGVRDYIENTPPALPGGETSVEPEIHPVTPHEDVLLHEDVLPGAHVVSHEIMPPALAGHEGTAPDGAHEAPAALSHDSEHHPPLETADGSAHPVLPPPAHGGA